jgi:hypothetical protein
MLVPVVGGSDKTTVSAATGQQEYHPVYVSPGNISNVARRSHGSGVLPVAFLPIPKGLLLYSSFVVTSQVFHLAASKRQRKKVAFKTFQRQLYHTCLEVIFGPLKPYTEKPKIIRCPDGHFRRAIFSIGPFIADYPEQVWLAGTVQNWCPKWVQMSH